MSAERPTSIPDGLVIELSRGKVLPGAGDEADRWMAMLNERNEVRRQPGRRANGDRDRVPSARGR